MLDTARSRLYNRSQQSSITRGVTEDHESCSTRHPFEVEANASETFACFQIVGLSERATDNNVWRALKTPEWHTVLMQEVFKVETMREDCAQERCRNHAVARQT